MVKNVRSSASPSSSDENISKDNDANRCSRDEDHEEDEEEEEEEIEDF
jgi:hypothetical protein